MSSLCLLIPVLGVQQACASLALPRSTYYRWIAPKPKSEKTRKRPANSLTAKEYREILSVLNSSEFMDMAPYEIFASLLDQGRYLCSIRTMYRVLQKAGQVKDRRNQRKHPKYVRPVLLATGPNQSRACSSPNTVPSGATAVCTPA